MDISYFNKVYLSPSCERFVQGWSITIIPNGILRHGYNKLPCMCLFILNGLQMLKTWHNKIAKEITLNYYCNCAQKASCPQLCLTLNLCPARCKVMSDNVNESSSRMANVCLKIHRFHTRCPSLLSQVQQNATVFYPVRGKIKKRIRDHVLVVRA